MKISKIEKQKKDKHRYSVYADDEFCLGAHEDTILKFGLRSGDEITDQMIEELKDYDEIINGKKVAYAFLSYRQRSKKEITNKLKQKKISEKNIEIILKTLEEQKYVDDSAFAKNFLEGKIRKKPAGKRMLRVKLFEKGIDKETTEKVISENFPEEKEIESAKELLKKFNKKHKGEDKFQLKRKSYRYLMSRGFDNSIIDEVLRIESE